jgi:hypothetical protein
MIRHRMADGGVLSLSEDLQQMKPEPSKFNVIGMILISYVFLVACFLLTFEVIL